MNPSIRLLPLILALVTATGWAQTVAERAANDDLSYMQDDDPAMRRAFQTARASLDEFLAKARAPADGTSAYAVKVGIREGRQTEYFWVNEFAQKGGSFTGRLNNEPRIVKRVRNGQPYTFTKAQIVDWTYVDDKAHRMLGNYTACALLSKEPPEEAAAMKEQYGLSCD